MGPIGFEGKMHDLLTFLETVDHAVAAGNLKALAAKTTDPDVLLGLAALARTGSPVRLELVEACVKAKPEYAPLGVVLAVTLDGADEKSVSELVWRDPDNALGHYLQGCLFYQGGKESEALEAFRKAAHCSELGFYEPTTGAALFRALDALNLQGRERLCALSWMETRLSNFRSICVQPISWALSELARSAATAVREEISDLLLVLAGHLFATNFQNRWYGERALTAAFGLKSEIAAGESQAKAYGYAAALQALGNAACYWPGLDEEPKAKPLQLAQFLPSRIHRAFAMIDPSKRKWLGELKMNPPERDKPAFESAIGKLVQAAEALLAIALTDPDGFLGPYLRGIPPSRKQQDRPSVPWCTPVGELLQKKPEIFRAAAVCEEASLAVWKAGQNDPDHLNMRRLMEIGLELHRYAGDHNQTFPENINALFDQGYLKPPLEAKSVLTGRPYIFAAVGEKRPTKQSDCFKLVLLYDDQANQYGCHPCVFASGVGGTIRGDDLKAQLGKRG